MRFIKVWWHCLKNVVKNPLDDHRMCADYFEHESTIGVCRHVTRRYCTCGYQP